MGAWGESSKLTRCNQCAIIKKSNVSLSGQWSEVDKEQVLGCTRVELTDFSIYEEFSVYLASHEDGKRNTAGIKLDSNIWQVNFSDYNQNAFSYTGCVYS